MEAARARDAAMACAEHAHDHELLSCSHQGPGAVPVCPACQAAAVPFLQPKQLSANEIHVLLVDDERITRTVVANLLRKCGYTGEWLQAVWRSVESPEHIFAAILCI